jgi:hypothetical protein
VTEISHPDARVSFLVPDRPFDADVIQSFCHFVHFLASGEAGRRWTAGHPSTFVVGLDDALDVARRLNRHRFGARPEAA